MADDHFLFSPSTFLGSDRRLARRVARPMARFLQIEAASGVLLILATVAALVWANSPWSDSYHHFWEAHIRLELGSWLTLDEPLEAWVNDGLMAIFFFVVGLEIKYELVRGELRDPRAAALPAVAALGGMIVPALIFAAFNAGSDAADGWGIPMATDIAFALGVVSLLGSRVPNSAKVFLLTLAIVDDLGAILVIAVFYTSDLEMAWLALAIGLLAFVYLLRRMHVWYTPLYVALGLFVWLAVFESGVHATIAGVALGLLTPASPLRRDIPPEELVTEIISSDEVHPVRVREARFLITERVAVAERLQTVLHPFASYLIIPVFALANAGIEISGQGLSDAATSSVTIGVALGLIVGKFVGVSVFTWAAVRLGLSRLPVGVRWAHVLGLAIAAGIGFTVSLFVTGLAFGDAASAAFNEQAKIGILVASATAAVLALITLSRVRASDEPDVVTADVVSDVERELEPLDNS